MRALFVSHGAPTIVIDDTPASRFLREADWLPAAPAIVVVSAHWCTRGVRVATAAQPATIHDFGGFPEALYRLQYPAPGAPALAQRIVEDLARLGIAAQADPARGFDHGVWTPLMLARPQAAIPVVAVSLPYPVSAADALRFGEALGTAVGDDAVILGSGSLTHRLAAYGEHAQFAPPAREAVAFAEWVSDVLARDDRAALADYRARAPHAAWNHPTDEHFLPLLVAVGAGGGPARRLHASWEWGILAMEVWSFGK